MCQGNEAVFERVGRQNQRIPPSAGSRYFDTWVWLTNKAQNGTPSCFTLIPQRVLRVLRQRLAPFVRPGGGRSRWVLAVLGFVWPF